MNLSLLLNWNLLLNCSLRADEAVDAFQLIVVESQRSQVSQVLERVLIDVVGLVVSDVEEQQVVRPVEDLQAPLPVDQLPVQLGQRVVAQVESHHLHQGVEDLMGEEMAGVVVAGDVEEQQVVEAG